MKKILITGCDGQMGKAIQREYADEPVQLYCMNSKTLDISNQTAVMETAKTIRPDVIINCAAYTAVDACEQELDKAYLVNAIGPRNLAIAASAYGSKLMHISTDYVFDGNGTRPYIEFDTPSPVSAYGKTKLAGEQYVRDFSDRFFIIRTAWLYGEGKNFVQTMLRLAENHQTISVVKDQLGSPTSTVELARMMHVLEGTDNYGIFHGTCEGSCSWADFASEIFRLAGKDVHVNDISTEEYSKNNPASARRPAYSVLDNYMLRLTSSHKMADWQQAIAAYLKEI